VTGFGKCNDGGWGAPGVPHPISNEIVSEDSARRSFMREGQS
jgi:hypothetical protein